MGDDNDDNNQLMAFVIQSHRWPLGAGQSGGGGTAISGHLQFPVGPPLERPLERPPAPLAAVIASLPPNSSEMNRRPCDVAVLNAPPPTFPSIRISGANFHGRFYVS